jgi:hypothetical protein
MSPSSEICAACRVDVGECPTCGTFWWRTGGKRQGCRPATEADARQIRQLQQRGDGGTGAGIVYAHELPNRIGVSR